MKPDTRAIAAQYLSLDTCYHIGCPAYRDIPTLIAWGQELEAALAAMTAERDSETGWAVNYQLRVEELEARLIDQTATVNRAVMEGRQRCLEAVMRFIKEHALCYPSELLSVENGIRHEIEGV